MMETIKIRQYSKTELHQKLLDANLINVCYKSFISQFEGAS